MMAKLFLAILISLSLSICFANDINTKIYYSPFNTTTIVPVDPTFIETRRICEFELTKQDDEEISAILNKTKLSPIYFFSDGFARVKIIKRNGEVIFMDSSTDRDERFLYLFGIRLTNEGKTEFENKMIELSIENPGSCKYALQ